MDTSLDTGRDSADSESGDSKPPGREPARERVYRILRDELLSAAVSPYHRFTEEGVASRLGVSRTPVRDALTRLQADGLLVKRDTALYRYVPSLVEFTELYELRLTLERRGIEKALSDPTVMHDRAMLDEELGLWYERRDSVVEPNAGFVTADEQFHVRLLGAAGNRELTKALLTVNQRIRPLRMHDYLTQDRVAATIAEHIQIGELVLRGRLAEALEALRSHVGESQAVVEARAIRAMHLSQVAGSEGLG